jgi:hypothetical protein
MNCPHCGSRQDPHDKVALKFQAHLEPVFKGRCPFCRRDWCIEATPELLKEAGIQEAKPWVVT